MIAARPFVSKEGILRSIGVSDSEAEDLFRALKRRKSVSSGVSVRPRTTHHGHFGGRFQVYSWLNEDAALLGYRRQWDEARNVARAAEAVEESSPFQDAVKQLRELAPSIPADGTDTLLEQAFASRESELRSAVSRAAVETETAWKSLPLPANREERLGGLVQRLFDNFAEIQVKSGLKVILDADLLEEVGARWQGAPVIVRVKQSKGQRMYRLEVGTVIPDELFQSGREQWFPFENNRTHLDTEQGQQVLRELLAGPSTVTMLLPMQVKDFRP